MVLSPAHIYAAHNGFASGGGGGGGFTNPTAQRFNGTDEYYRWNQTQADLTLRSVNGAFSLSWWHMFNNVGGGFMGGRSGSGGFDLIKNGSQYAFRLDDSAGATIFVPGTLPSQVQFDHYVAVFDGVDTVDLYRNGSFDATHQNGSFNGNNATTVDEFWIGRSSVSNYGGGDFDEVAFFDTNLSAGQITTLYNSGLAQDLAALPFASNLANWWRMNGTLTDQAGSADATSRVNMDATNDVAGVAVA